MNKQNHEQKKGIPKYREHGLSENREILLFSGQWCLNYVPRLQPTSNLFFIVSILNTVRL
jgi:hypothetical protein